MGNKRWDKAKAQRWYEKQGWIVGCNFIPSTAINQLEMWQAETFDIATIDRELGRAAGIGFNTVRVYLHDLLWEGDKKGFIERIERYLKTAHGRGIRTLFTIFDDCWNNNARLGRQPAPVPGVHNSGWLQSPGVDIVNDSSKWMRLEKYVTELVERFRQDERILMWDVYNEPGNSKQETKSLPLLRKVFEWAGSARPSQPLTSGVWIGNNDLKTLQLEGSDVVTFHNYENADSLSKHISDLKKYGRPLICTEWMARPNSIVTANLPVFKKESVGCIIWGLVSGKTQTIFPWGSKEGAAEPDVWFHDLFRRDGTPFDAREIELFRSLTGAGAE